MRRADIRIGALALAFSIVLACWHFGWPSVIAFVVADVVNAIELRWTKERESQFAALREELAAATAKHREELVRLHANLKEVGDAVASVRTQDALRMRR